MSATVIERRNRASGEEARRAASTARPADRPDAAARPQLVLLTGAVPEARPKSAPRDTPAPRDVSAPTVLQPRRGHRLPRRRATARCVPASGPPRRQAGLRLTRRGRLTVTVSTVVLTAALGWVAHLSSAQHTAADRAGGSGSGTASVVVRPGETLWDIATRTRPQADPRMVVARIERINSLDGPMVHPGQRLILPAAA